MNGDDLDDLIRQSDPIRSAPDGHETFAELHRQQWRELYSRRSTRRKRLSWSVAAIAVFATGAIGFERLSSRFSRDGQTQRVSVAVDLQKKHLGDERKDLRPSPLSTRDATASRDTTTPHSTGYQLASVPYQV